MRSILSERNIVVALFAMVLVTFSLAHEDSKKMERSMLDGGASVSFRLKPSEAAVIHGQEQLAAIILLPRTFPR